MTEGLKPNRDNVRTISRSAKGEIYHLNNILEQLEELHTAYATKRNKPKLNKEFKATKTALNKLLTNLKEQGF